MDLNHLHLHVRDVAHSRRFYEAHFGFRERVSHGDILFLRNDEDFDLALAPDPDPDRFPAWFHYGFRLPSPALVRDLYARLAAAGATEAKSLVDDPDLVSFRCQDPDGNRIEVYWE